MYPSIYRILLLFGALYSTLGLLSAQTLNAELLNRRCRPGVLLIDNGAGGSGTGFLISEQGHVLTNEHVIDGSGFRAEASFPSGESYAYVVVDVDEAVDIALIKLVDFRCAGCTVLPILPDGNGPTGAEVATIGNPEGLRFTTTKGIISNEILHPNVDFMLQTDVATNAGNSGGPLLNRYGQVVGIVTARLERGAWGERDFQNMNFAINATAIRRFVRQQRLGTLSVTPLVSDSELSARLRDLTPAEIAAQEQAELERVRLGREREAERDRSEKERERERAELEREQMRRQLLDAMELDQLSADQKREVERINFEGQKRIAAAQARADEQRIVDAATRATQAIASEELRLARERQELIERRRRYRASLPHRVGFRLGGGFQEVTHVFDDGAGGPRETAIADFAPDWLAQAAVTFRFDVSPTTDRGSAFGFFTRVGSQTGLLAVALAREQNLPTPTDPMRRQLFVEYEAGLLIREFLRVSGGVGRQSAFGDDPSTPNQGFTTVSTRYGVGTLGVLVRVFKRIELSPQAVVQFGSEFGRPVLRAEVVAQLRLGVLRG